MRELQIPLRFTVTLLVALILGACAGNASVTEPGADSQFKAPGVEEKATPNPTPNIDATVEARIQDIMAAMPTPSPVPTSMPRISAVEAIERLKIHFEKTYERREAWSAHKERVDSGMYNGVPGCDPIAIHVESNYENCPEFVRLGMGVTALEQSKEFARRWSDMTAEYQGSGTWLITVRGEHLFNPTLLWSSLPDGKTFEEQWWLFESGDTPPRLAK